MLGLLLNKIFSFLRSVGSLYIDLLRIKRFVIVGLEICVFFVVMINDVFSEKKYEGRWRKFRNI